MTQAVGMRNTGYYEASEWLSMHSPRWMIVRSEGRFITYTYGPGVYAYSVELAREYEVMENNVTVTLHGEGTTILDAVQRAVGGLVE